METKQSVFYIEIDALMDTRLPVLKTFGVDVVENVIANGYHKRLFDEFEGIDTEEFKRRYAARDLTILRDALITPMVLHVNRFARQTALAYVSSPYRRLPKVVVNMYPYKSTEDWDKIILAGLRAATKGALDIEIMNASPEEITPAYVSSNYVMMAMYSYADWLEVHSVNKSLADSRCQSVFLLAPQLIKSKEAAKELEGIDAFQATENYASLFIRLQLRPIAEFCVDIHRLRELKGKQTT